MHSCDSHKTSRASQDLADKRLEQVEKLELLAKDIAEQMHDAVALTGEQQELIIAQQKR
jgi:hypothetical protein